MSETEETDAELLLQSLKQLLRERGITYPQLAKQLRVSLPTIKRMLNKPSLPLDRLLEICRFTGIELQDLIERAQTDRPRHTEYTAEQDELFHRLPCMLGYFSELFYKRRRPSEIARQHGLSKHSTDIYLSQLEKVGLLQRQPNSRVKFLVSPPLGFGPGSKVLRHLHRQFMKDIIRTVVDPPPDEQPKDAFAILKPLQLSPTAWREFIQGITELVDRFAFLSERAPAKEVHRSWQLAIAAGPGPDSNRPEDTEWTAVKNLTLADLR